MSEVLGYETVVEIYDFLFGKNCIDLGFQIEINFNLKFMNFFQKLVQVERSHAEVTQTDADEKGQIVKVVNKFSADAYRDMVFAGIFYGKTDEFQYGRGKFVISVGGCLLQASVYWVRSFVPMEKKSTSGARESDMSAPAGVSIIMPILTLPVSWPSEVSDCFTLLYSSISSFVSSYSATIGNMMRICLCAEALSMALSCVIRVLR